MSTTRDRRLAFIGDKYAIARAVNGMLMRQGPDWLTDEQIDDLVRQAVSDRRFAARIARKNRRMAAELRADDLLRDHASRARRAEMRTR